MKRTFDRDGDGICSNCGRTSPPCHCGEEVGRKCSAHGYYLQILAIPIYRTEKGVRFICGWVDICECPENGCTIVRSCKVQDGKPRNQNRKTTRKVKR